MATFSFQCMLWNRDYCRLYSSLSVKPQLKSWFDNPCGHEYICYISFVLHALAPPFILICHIGNAGNIEAIKQISSTVLLRTCSPCPRNNSIGHFWPDIGLDEPTSGQYWSDGDFNTLLVITIYLTEFAAVSAVSIVTTAVVKAGGDGRLTGGGTGRLTGVPQGVTVTWQHPCDEQQHGIMGLLCIGY